MVRDEVYRVAAIASRYAMRDATIALCALRDLDCFGAQRWRQIFLSFFIGSNF